MSVITSFSALALPPALTTALSDLGYETPTPIQAESIPLLLAGRDLLAQAQTGTGKTAAFALPILAKIDVQVQHPQALVIAPTRELAIQVAEAFQSYAKNLKGFHVLPIYGGQDYTTQLRALKRGAHVVVGTPGRVMDHLRRGTLSTKALSAVVLDEADEMLKMGFIDDVEWILEQISQTHQTALFSATMPPAIQKIAKRYLIDAEKILIQSQNNTVDAIDQAYIRVNNNQKLELLTRILEVEDVKAAMIFSRTKTVSSELAQKLQARGYRAAALNGDMNQAIRKRAVEQLKSGVLDMLVATDVAARGIDVERVSHVINYDIPHDTESYIHRIGRTGRAGRAGKAILFVAPREERLLRDIERAIHKPIKETSPPSLQAMSEKRSQQLAEKVLGVLQKSKKLKPYQEMIDHILVAHPCSEREIAVALVYLLQQANPLPAGEMDVVKAEAPAYKRGKAPPARFDRRKTGGGSSSGGRFAARDRDREEAPKRRRSPVKQDSARPPRRKK